MGGHFQSVTPTDVAYYSAPCSLYPSHTDRLIAHKPARLAPASGPLHLLFPPCRSLSPVILRGSLLTSFMFSSDSPFSTRTSLTFKVMFPNLRFLSSFLKKKNYLPLAALGLCCRARAFSNCDERGRPSSCDVAWASHCSGFDFSRGARGL